jgi:hypothetical protein
VTLATDMLAQLKANTEETLRQYRLAPRGGNQAVTHRFWLDVAMLAFPGGKTIKIKLGREPSDTDDNVADFQGYNIPAVKSDTIVGLRAQDPGVSSQANLVAIKSGSSPKLAFNVSKPALKLGVKGPTGLIQAQGLRMGAAGADPDMMITTEFSGCSFMFQRSGDALLAAHIWPEAPLNGHRLHSILMESGRFAGEPAAFHPVVYGANFYKGNKPTKGSIIGVRHGTVWSLYHQLHDGQNTIFQVAKIL